MLNGSRFIRNWIRAGTRFNDPSREKRHQEAIDELEKLLAEDSKSPLFTNSAKYFTSKKRRKKLKNLHEKITKDTLYNQAARELIGFKFENHAAWVGCSHPKIKTILKVVTQDQTVSFRHPFRKLNGLGLPLKFPYFFL